MTIHEKLAARLRDLSERLHETHCHEPKLSVFRACESLAEYVESGNFDDILGVREPTIEDVKREAVRVYGKHAAVRAWEDGLSIQVGTVVLNEPLYAPTIAAVYAALRALPDYEGEK